MKLSKLMPWKFNMVQIGCVSFGSTGYTEGNSKKGRIVSFHNVITVPDRWTNSLWWQKHDLPWYFGFRYHVPDPVKYNLAPLILLTERFNCKFLGYSDLNPYEISDIGKPSIAQEISLYEVHWYNGVITSVLVNGGYIGTIETAWMLYKKYGIDLSTYEPEHVIAFSPREQKWYGWSHRAIHGFGICDSVKPGDVAYNPSNVMEWIEGCFRWCNNSEERYPFTDWRFENKYLVLISPYHNHKVTIPLSECKTNGRGSWTANTLADARLIAIDYAEDVS